MGLMDRDWYRAELTQRERCLRRGKRWHALATVIAGAAIVATMLVILPVGFTSRCDVGSWQRTPVACWHRSWAALSDRVAGNMAATRGWPFSVVRVGR